MRRICASAGLAVLLAGCGSQPLPEVEPGPLPVQPPGPAAAAADPIEWSGFIYGESGASIEGTAMAHVNPVNTIVFVRVRGVGEQDMPWHLHEGTCDTPGGAIIGPETGYPLLRRGDERTVESYSELFNIRLHDARQYKVDVHASLVPTSPVVGCANLTRRP